MFYFAVAVRIDASNLAKEEGARALAFGYLGTGPNIRLLSSNPPRRPGVEFAHDVLARRLISAEKVRDRDRPYRCPVCDGRVYHASGYFQDAHFRHRPGEGKPECDLYYPGNGDYGSSPARYRPISRSQSADQKFAHLALRIDDRDAKSWRLFVSLPPPGSRQGELKLRVGATELRVVPVVAIGSKWWHQPVVACHGALGVIGTSKNVDPRYAERISSSETSLNVNGVTAFSASEFDRYVRRAAKLFWGTAYYLIFDAKRNIKVPELLNPRELKLRDGFRCVMVTLPAQARKDVAEWLERETRLTPLVRRAKITVLFPDVLKVDNGLPTPLARAEQILLSVQRQTIDSDVRPELWLETEAGNSVSVLAEEQVTLIRIPVRPADRHLYVRYADEGGALFELRDREADLNSIHAVVKVKAAEGVSVAPAFSEAARGLLQRVRLGHARIVRIETPESFDMHVQTREITQDAWMSIPGSPQPFSVQSLLRNRLHDVALDFGPFGVLRFRAPRAAAPATKKLSVKNRDIVRWLLSQYREAMFSMSPNSSDVELMMALESITPRACHLAHYRAICNAWDTAS